MVLKETYVSTMRAVSTEASTTGASNHACFMDFQLVEIPDVMEQRLNARQGAELMRRWFDSPAFTLPEAWRLGHVNYRSVPAKNLDTSIIKMSWAPASPAPALPWACSNRAAPIPPPGPWN
jgi:hypothetical protein